MTDELYLPQESVSKVMKRAQGQRFDPTGTSDKEMLRMFDQYFAVLPWESLPRYAAGFDAGSGSGRWAVFVCGGMSV
jgi:hypothetical protein